MIQISNNAEKQKIPSASIQKKTKQPSGTTSGAGKTLSSQPTLCPDKASEQTGLARACRPLNPAGKPCKKQTRNRAGRDAKIEIRCSKEEQQAWKQKAQQAGITLSALIRKALIRVTIVPQAVQKKRNQELARIASNLNQLARWANTYKGNAEAVQVIGWLISIREEVSNVYESLSTRNQQ